MGKYLTLKQGYVVGIFKLKRTQTDTGRLTLQVKVTSWLIWEYS